MQAKRRPIVTDDDVAIVIYLALAAVWLPAMVVKAGWRWLRGQ